MADPKGFMKHDRATPVRRAPDERAKDWREFYESMPVERLRAQASRCMDCGVPFCQSPSGCPVENLIPEWNDLAHQDRWDEASASLHSTNNFPEFTGKLCPAPCESACVLGINQDPVSIRTIESSIVDRAFEEGWVRPERASRRTGRRVAVIGSGPAGLAAAQQLARAGHDVTVFERSDRIGGLLRYGIPDFKMEKHVLDRRLEQMKAEGVLFVTDADVGGDQDPHELLQEYDALCLTIGASVARDLAVPGRNLGGIHYAMDYLTQQNRRNAGDWIEPRDFITAHGKRVVIIGGGDTGSDCLGTAHRQGCLEAHQFELLPKPPLARADSTPWPLWPLQLRTSHAHEEGCDRQWSVLTTGFSGEGGRVSRLHAQKGSLDGGKWVPQPGGEFTLEADLVLLAMGFTGPATPLLEKLGVERDGRGAIRTNPRYMTNVPGVFAAGDCRRGASLIVWAISEGRKMASAVCEFLRADQKLRPMPALSSRS